VRLDFVLGGRCTRFSKLKSIKCTNKGNHILGKLDKGTRVSIITSPI